MEHLHDSSSSTPAFGTSLHAAPAQFTDERIATSSAQPSSNNHSLEGGRVRDLVAHNLHSKQSAPSITLGRDRPVHTFDLPYRPRISDFYPLLKHRTSMMNSHSREDSRSLSNSHRRRGSPGADGPRHARRERSRSRSPREIDRYQPRDDHYRTRGDYPRRRASPPVQQIDRYVPGQDSSLPKFNPLANPMTIEYQVGFNYFAEWWREEQKIKEDKKGIRKPVVRGEREAREERAKEHEQIQAAYDEYKEKLQVQMARSFVEKHKEEEWFQERYDPEQRGRLRQKLNEFRRPVYHEWQRQLNEGLFDDFTLEGIYKNESNGAGGIVEKEEGETTAANEVLGVGDLVPCKGGELRDEAALQPTLLIKTIAPTVNRDKIEEFCKEHLGEGPGGFKWLSLSDPNPTKKCHRIGWVILNAGDDQAVVKEERVDDRVEAEDHLDEGAEMGLPDAPPSTAQRALDALNGKTVQDPVRGNFTCHVGVHEPPAAPRKKALWDLFSAPERIERDLQLAIRLATKLDEELGDEDKGLVYRGVDSIEQRVEDLRSKGWLQPPANAPATAKKEKDVDDLEEGEDAMDEDEGLLDDEVDDEDLLAKKKKLDLLIEYLRRVYNFCFFCVFESDSVHELVRKCPGGHLRRPRSSLTSAAKTTARATASGQPFPFKKQDGSGDMEMDDSPEERKVPKVSGRVQQQLQRAFNWVKTYEEKLLQILEPEHADLKKLGGKPEDEAIEDELKKFVKQEDESKWRCKVPECTKLFKAHHFWRKHVEKRHTEWFEKLKRDIYLVNSYVLDPAHIAPSRSDANSNGHFPVGNHMTAGTPRGFNLASMPNFNLSGGPNNGMLQALFNPALGSGQWSGSGDDDRHQAGAMRRTGHRYSSRVGPYDRQPRDGRGGRYSNSGRLTPPPRGGPRTGGGRYDDELPGPSAPFMQDRAIKSYKDLDAVQGGNIEVQRFGPQFPGA